MMLYKDACKWLTACQQADNANECLDWLLPIMWATSERFYKAGHYKKWREWRALHRAGLDLYKA